MSHDLTINSNSSYRFDDLKPLSLRTQNTLRIYIFEEISFEGGCARLQAFAQKVSTLKDLQKKYSDQEIGSNDRAIAIAKCVVLALLVAAFFTVCVYTCVFMPVSTSVFIPGPPNLFKPLYQIFFTPSMPLAFKTAHEELMFIGFIGSLIGTALSLLGLMAEGAVINKISQRPSKQDVDTELDNLAKMDLSIDDLKNLISLQGLLKEKIDQITEKLNEQNLDKQRLGIKPKNKTLETKKKRLEAAFVDVSKMYEALTKKPQVLYK